MSTVNTNELTKKEFLSLKTDWVNTLFLTLTPIVGSILLWVHIKYEGFNPQLLFGAVFFYFLCGLGITAGYHRLLAHRSYKAHPIVKTFLLIFGAGAFQNSALKWCSDHRRHHTHCDHELDPYNISKGFFWAHIGWVMKKEPIDYIQRFGGEMKSDKLILWQHKYYLALSILVGFGLPLAYGFYMGSPIGGLALAGVLRIVFVHHCTFFINSLCHMVGQQTYTDTNTAKDSPIIALFSYGEGYHNFHHFFQTDYRNGVRFYHFDPTKWLIRSLSFLGLTYDLIRTPDEVILKAKVNMQEIRAKDKLAEDSVQYKQIVMAKEVLDTCLAKITELKKQLRKHGPNTEELKRKLQELQKELKADLESWKMAISGLQLA
jgi:stearoyl-CoA desaturase (Delta-9 desaturase)